MTDKEKDFEHWVKHYAGDLYRYAYWLARDHGIAQDLVQEAFARGWKYFHTLQKPEQARSWLMTIVKRENARRFEKKRVQIVEAGEDYIENVPEEPDNPMVEMLRQHIQRLPDDYREPLVKQVLYGNSCDEIAKEMKLTRAAVMTRLYRARNMLRDTIKAEQEAENKHDRRPK